MHLSTFRDFDSWIKNIRQEELVCMVTQLSFLQRVYGRQRRVGDVIERSYIRRTKVQIYIGVFQKPAPWFLVLLNSYIRRTVQIYIRVDQKWQNLETTKTYHINTGWPQKCPLAFWSLNKFQKLDLTFSHVFWNQNVELSLFHQVTGYLGFTWIVWCLFFNIVNTCSLILRFFLDF